MISMSLNLVKTSNRRRKHEPPPPKTGVCNWCRGVMDIDTWNTNIHHMDGRLQNPHGNRIEVCEQCHWYWHAITGTGAHNGPHPYWQVFTYWIRMKNAFLDRWGDDESYGIFQRLFIK